MKAEYPCPYAVLLVRSGVNCRRGLTVDILSARVLLLVIIIVDDAAKTVCKSL
jgi:hypothetical protein